MGSNDSEQLRTVYVGNIANDTSEDHLYELFLQAGPLDYVKIPVDRTTKVAKNFAFVCYRHECSVPYAIHLLNNINLSGRNIRVQARENRDAIKDADIVGIHSLDPDFKVAKVSESGSNISQRLSYGKESSLLGAPPPLMAHNPYMYMDPSQLNISYRNQTNLYATASQRQQTNSYNYSYYNNANNHYNQGLTSIDTHSMNHMKNTYNSNQNYSRSSSDRSQNYNNSNSDDRSYRNRHSSDRHRDNSHHRSDEYRNSNNRNYRNRPYDKFKDGNSHGSRY